MTFQVTTKEIIERYYDWKKRNSSSHDTEVVDEDEEDVDGGDVDDEE